MSVGAAWWRHAADWVTGWDADARWWQPCALRHLPDSHRFLGKQVAHYIIDLLLGKVEASGRHRSADAGWLTSDALEAGAAPSTGGVQAVQGMTRGPSPCGKQHERLDYQALNYRRLHYHARKPVPPACPRYAAAALSQS